MTKQQRINYLQDIWDEAVKLTWHSRREAREMYEYLRGNQLPDDVIATLESRGQPIQWENVIQEIDTSIEGMKLMTRTELSLTNRHPEDEERVKVMESIHKSTLDAPEWWENKARSDLDLRIVGLSAIETVLVNMDEFDGQGKRLREMRHDYLPALECYIDMYSRKTDYSDARYFHHSRMYDKKTLVRKFGAEAKKLEEDNYGMCRVTRTWYRDGDTIRIATWYGDVVLEDIAQPYTKTKGRFSVAVRRTKITHVREYVGMYRNVKPFQDKINNMMLRLINMLGSSKLLVEASAVADIDVFQEEYSMDNSVTVVNDGTLKDKRIQDIRLTNDITQLMSLVQDARRKALQIMGLNPELLGTSTIRQSGVALEIKQNAGLVGLQKFLTTSTEMDKDLLELDSGIMQQYFTAEQVFSITGREGVKEHFYLNEYERDATGRVMFKDGVPMQQNILFVGRYDLTIDQVPFNNGSSDAKMKSWAEMMKIIPPEKAAALIPSMLRDVGSAQADETRDILAKLDAQAAQAPQGEDPAMQQMKLQMQTMQAKIEEMVSKANLNNAKAGEIAGSKGTE